MARRPAPIWATPVADADAERQLFDDALYCDGPARLRLEAVGLPEGALDEALQVLAAIAVVEDRRGDEAGSGAELAQAVRRLDAKLDLTLLLLARLIPELQGPPPRSVRLGVRGLRLEGEVPAARQAVLHWQPADWLPISLRLPVRALSREGGVSCWAFEPLGSALEEALERHVFRLHRRWRASQRG